MAPGPDEVGGARQEILAVAVADDVVVRAHEGADDAARGAWPVAEGLAGEHRDELHGTGAVGRGAVSAAAQTDVLVADDGGVRDVHSSRASQRASGAPSSPWGDSGARAAVGAAARALREISKKERRGRGAAAARLHELADMLPRHNDVEFERGGIHLKVHVPDEVE